MNRLNWVYLADGGVQHQVGLMHGAKTGHLLVYCNTRIVLIDFKVKKDKTYSFFIDEQLCEIDIEQHGADYRYAFRINKEADTPRNNLRRKIEKRDMLLSILTIGGVVLTAILFLWLVRSFNATNHELSLSERLRMSGEVTRARVLFNNSNQADDISYFFFANGKSYIASAQFTGYSPVKLVNGMTLQEGDEFLVKYLPDDPEQHKIDFSQPSEEQIGRYKERAALIQSRYHPYLSDYQVKCFVNSAYELQGISALADIYAQQVSPEQQSKHNSSTFNRLVTNEGFRLKVNEECGISDLGN